MKWNWSDVRGSLSGIVDKLKSEKKLALIVGLGVLGVLFIALSAIPKSPAKTAQTQPASAPTVGQADVSDYVAQMEERLTGLISAIDGAGRTRVMLTLECGTEEVYAGDESQKTSGNESNASLESRFEYLTLKAKDGSEAGLLLTVLQPRVRGVAVVCDGGGSALVQTAISQTVTAVLDVSAARVSITKMQ
ncbi:MAG: stage III sporulation protein AG [Oscillospiraceae bacterium]|jgi:stage III sporulation protein AG|nr:stage III sporulation protein AG [Oscillospiraceae bacterium]